jgi:uncharacterized RDD family membrane protein YckC
VAIPGPDPQQGSVQTHWQLSTEVGPAAGWRYGGFWIRFVAYVIDQILIWIVLVAVFAMVGQGREYQTLDDGTKTILGLIALIVFFGYLPLFWGIRGQTPGMMPFGLRIFRTSGNRIGIGRAYLRFLGFIVSAIPIYLGLIWAGIDGRKQGWHDKIADTVVVRPG